MDVSLHDFIKALPKTETHLHIEGALPWSLLQAANPGKYRSVPASWAPDFRFRDFAHFESELLGYVGDFFISPERYHECACAVFADRLARNIRYTEVSFASGCIDFMKLDGREVCEAIRSAVPAGLEVRVFIGIHHEGYTQKMAPILEDALTWASLDGIDLHGAEPAPLGDWAETYWRRARDAGKFTKAHAGEFCGPDFIRHVVEKLGAQRIEHGVRAIEDPAVLDLLRERGIALDVCPVSNVKLGVVPAADQHPIRRLLDAGIVCTISTDDPISFGNTLEDEYLLLAENLSFTRDELAGLAHNGFRVALTTEEWKRRALASE
jgi:adenosine deaminase